MPGPLESQVVASRYANPALPSSSASNAGEGDTGGGEGNPAVADRGRLWRAAIKWPMYAVAVMPVLLAAGWRLGQELPVRADQVGLFLLAAILLAGCSAQARLEGLMAVSADAHWPAYDLHLHRA